MEYMIAADEYAGAAMSCEFEDRRMNRIVWIDPYGFVDHSWMAVIVRTERFGIQAVAEHLLMPTMK